MPLPLELLAQASNTVTGHLVSDTATAQTVTDSVTESETSAVKQVC